MEGPRLAILVFLLIFLLISPDGSNRPSSPRQRDELSILFEHEHNSLDILSQTKFGEFNPQGGRYLNLTGLRKEDGYAWNLLPKVKARVEEHIQSILKPWEEYDLGERYSSSDALDGEGQNLSLAVGGKPLAIPFYQNVTGLANGRWVRSGVEKGHVPPVLNLTELSPHVPYVTQEYNRNITGREGDLTFKLDEKNSQILHVDQGVVREIRAEMTISDETSSGDGWELTLHGLHFPETGGIVLVSTSDRFDGIFALPHLTRSSAASSLVQRLLNQTIPAAIHKQEMSPAIPGFPWAAISNNPGEIMFPTPHCEYIVYLQQNIIWPYSAGPPYDVRPGSPSYLERLEDELRFPTGAPLPKIRDMEFSAVIFSPDCGFVLESKGPPDFSPNEAAHLHGPKSESFYMSIRRLVEVLAIIVIGQAYLLIRQMKDASTPSTKSRISFYTVAMMGLGDGFVCLSFLTISLFMDAVFLVIVATAFMAFLCVSFFGMKFLIDVWTVQAPERLEQQREQERRRQEALTLRSATNPQTVQSQRPTEPAPTSESLPLPVTARPSGDTGAMQVILPPDQDIEADAAEILTPAQVGTAVATQPTVGSARREMGTMYSRFYFVLIGVLFLSLNATTWPQTLRSIYANLLAAVYLSFWVPQIKRNIERNCRKAFRWEFILGQSVLRLIPFYYFYSYPENVLYVKTDSYAMIALLAWVWIQVCILISHELLGPRFLIPHGWAPPAYDYHPVLRENDEESGATMPIGFTQATAEGDLSARTAGQSREHGKRTFDCAICMQDIDVPVVPAAGGAGDSAAGSALAANLFGRRAYMVTPCRHIFHSACLEGWMRYKLQCPICRESLPPL